MRVCGEERESCTLCFSLISDITRPASDHSKEIAGATKPVHVSPAGNEASNYLDKGVNEEQQRKKDELKVSSEIKQSLGESITQKRSLAITDTIQSNKQAESDAKRESNQTSLDVGPRLKQVFDPIPGGNDTTNYHCPSISTQGKSSSVVRGEEVCESFQSKGSQFYGRHSPYDLRLKLNPKVQQHNQLNADAVTTSRMAVRSAWPEFCCSYRRQCISMCGSAWWVASCASSAKFCCSHNTSREQCTSANISQSRSRLQDSNTYTVSK